MVDYGVTKSKNPDPNRRRHNRSKNIADRLWERVDRSAPDGCWPWTGPAITNGYGCFSWQNRQVRTHRVSYELHYGPIPEGMYVCHRCDNPLCVKPSHLFLGSPAVNVADMIGKGRSRSPRGAANGAAKLTRKQADSIRAQHGAATYRALADAFGVSVTTIHNIMHGLVWVDEHDQGAMGFRTG